MEPLFVENSIIINAPANLVWKALTDPAETKKYMFGCETVSDWKPGSPLLWRGNHEGKEIVFVKGVIVKIEPGKHLAYTTFDPFSTLDDIPENHLTVTYDLHEENGKTTLHVKQGDFATVGDGQKRFIETYNNGEGWNPILEMIKKQIEETR